MFDDGSDCVGAAASSLLQLTTDLHVQRGGVTARLRESSVLGIFTGTQRLHGLSIVLVTCLGATCVGVTLFYTLVVLRRSRLKQPSNPSLSKETQTQTELSWAMLAARTVTAASSMVEGYEMCSMSGVISKVTHDLHLSSWQSAWAMGISPFMMALGAPLGGWLADRVGRLPALLASYLAMISGPILMGCSQSFGELIMGRSIQAIGMGAGMGVSVIYMTEVAPAAIRGRFPSLEELLLGVSMASAYLGCSTLQGAPEGWRWMLGLGGVPPALALPLLGLAPESPRYLLMRGRQGEAEEALLRLVAPEEARGAMAQFTAEHGGSGPATWADALWPEDPVLRRSFFVGVGVFSLQFLSGIRVVMSYADTVMAKDVGESLAHTSMLLLTIGRTLAVLPAIMTLDTLVRRSMLIAGQVGTSLALVLVAVFYWTGAAVLPCVYFALVLFAVSYSQAIGPVAWVYTGEVMDSAMRAKGVAVAVFAARVCAGCMLLVYPAARDHLGTGWTFMILALCNVCGLVFVCLCVRETAGVSIERMRKVFEHD
uniref:Hexose transporter 1 n=1 Tax=Alexandrium monilatum TaxID=311494 RepID=A0A7S4W682_9DINO